MNGLRNYRYYLSNISNILILLASPIDCGAQEIKCNIKYIRLATTDNSPSQDYTHPDDQTSLLHVTPGFKPFTVVFYRLHGRFA